MSQHQVNTELTPSQQPEKLENLLNCENIDNTDVVEEEEVIQHQPDTQGERVSVESVESENVVQKNNSSRRFKVGDKVKMGTDRLKGTLEKGTTGVIQEVVDRGVRVLFPGGERVFYEQLLCHLELA